MPHIDSPPLSETAQVACLLLHHDEFTPRELADAVSAVLGRRVARIEPYIQQCRNAGATIRTERGEDRISWYRLVTPPCYDDGIVAAYAARCTRVVSELQRGHPVIRNAALRPSSPYPPRPVVRLRRSSAQR